MKKLLCFSCGLLVATVGVRATSLFSDTFNSYANANLVGQGTWVQQGTVSSSPVQVSSGMVLLGPTGQDVNAPLSSPYTLVDGTSFYIGADINLSAAGTGDYFLHWSPASGSTIFISRVEARASGSGYQLGYVVTSGGTPTLYWGTGVLSFGQNYSMILAYNSVAGALNDTADMYVNPTDPLVRANNTPYLSQTVWDATGAEQTTLGALNLRQGGGAAAAPTLTLDNLTATTTFAEAAAFTAVPEPTSLSLLGGFGLLALLINRRRK